MSIYVILIYMYTSTRGNEHGDSMTFRCVDSFGSHSELSSALVLKGSQSYSSRTSIRTSELMYIKLFYILNNKRYSRLFRQRTSFFNLSCRRTQHFWWQRWDHHLIPVPICTLSIKNNTLCYISFSIT